MVDEAITVLKISITGAPSETDVDIIYADGKIHTLLAVGMSWRFPTMGRRGRDRMVVVFTTKVVSSNLA